MPTLQDDGWELENVEALRAQHPHNFHIPTREERAGLRIGARVKLLFLFRDEQEKPTVIQCERMWCTVREVAGGKYIGTLDSYPATSRLLQPGERIEFGPEHIASVLITKDDPRHPNYGKDSNQSN